MLRAESTLRCRSITGTFHFPYSKYWWKAFVSEPRGT